MKKGFTMIELIFVIVILGILASVAIPRLAATRDDAEIVKMGTNLTTLISDIGAYYTSQGEFADSLTKMTNVVIDSASGSKAEGFTGNLTSAGKKCVAFEVKPAVNSDTEKTPAYILVKNGDDANEAICKKVLDLDSIKKIMAAKVVKQTKAAEDSWSDSSKVTSTDIDGAYQVTGLSVQF